MLIQGQNRVRSHEKLTPVRVRIIQLLRERDLSYQEIGRRFLEQHGVRVGYWAIWSATNKVKDHWTWVNKETWDCPTMT